MRSRSGSLLAVPDAARTEHRAKFPLIKISPTTYNTYNTYNTPHKDL
ncbi:MAG: hypothetical protein F6K56_24935 [Moorea sp. SIO3G5]|nr:hypothetical protein [Moorena sp. SIO3G5]